MPIVIMHQTKQGEIKQIRCDICGRSFASFSKALCCREAHRREIGGLIRTGKIIPTERKKKR